MLLYKKYARLATDQLQIMLKQLQNVSIDHDDLILS